MQAGSKVQFILCLGTHYYLINIFFGNFMLIEHPHNNAKSICFFGYDRYFPLIYRPQTKFAKVMFLQVSVCPRGSGGVVSQHTLQVVSQHALQGGGGIPACIAAGGWYPSMPCSRRGLQAHTQVGS